MLKKVLVPVDGSLFSEQALPMALAAARRAGAALHIVQVHEPAAPLTIPLGYLEALPRYDLPLEDELRAREEERLAALADVAATREGVPAQTALLGGDVVSALDEYAAGVGIDLVVMTTHGRGGLSRAWMGSVADALVRQTELPILLLRPTASAPEREGMPTLRSMLVPLDGSELAEGILGPASRLALLFDARIELFRVCLPSYVASSWESDSPVPQGGAAGDGRGEAEARAYLEAVAERLREEGLEVGTGVVRHAQAARAILEEVVERGADAIAMSTRGRGGWSRLALGSVADKVFRAADVPVLLQRGGAVEPGGAEPRPRRHSGFGPSPLRP